MPFWEALAEAQALGFAEADPVAGHRGVRRAGEARDPGAARASRPRARRARFRPGAIDAIDAVDFLYAQQMGCTIRQVAWAERTADPHVLTAAVGPALVPLDSPLARVRGSENLVTLRGQFGGETTFGGLGAGGDPTAVAVMSDLLAIAREGAPFGTRPAVDRAPRSRQTSRARITSASPSRIARASSRRWRRCSRGTTSTSTRFCRSRGFPTARRPFVVSLDPAPVVRDRSGDSRKCPRAIFTASRRSCCRCCLRPGSRSRRMSYRAEFRCVAGCPGSYPLDTVIYRCPTCGGSARGRRTISTALRDRSAAAWMRLFDERYKRTTWPYGSSVWGKKEWVCPRDQGRATSCRWTKAARTSFSREAFGAVASASNEVWVKLCGNSHTGSFKDLGMTVLVSMVRQMMAQGRQIRAVGCASTGDTSASLAAYAAAAGIPAIVVLPRGKVTVAQLVQPLANGAIVLRPRHRLRRLHGDHPAARRRRRAVPRELDEQPAARGAEDGRRSRSRSSSTGRCPDVVIVPGGNLGNISAFAAGFEMMRELGLVARVPRLIAAQAEAANPLYLASQDGWHFEPVVAKPTLASAIQIGNPVSVHKAIAALQRSRRHGRAGERAGTGRRGRARGQDRHVRLPPHRCCPCGADQARGTRGNRALTSAWW